MSARDPFSRPGSFVGIDIYVTPDVPKMQLSPRVCEVLNPKFIAEMNAWLENFFGLTNPIPDGETRMNLHQAWMNPRTYAQFKAATKGRAS